MLEEDYEFTCPHCGAGMSIRLDASGGQHQNFIYDCETCCRPIKIQVGFEGDEIVSFLASNEDE